MNRSFATNYLKKKLLKHQEKLLNIRNVEGVGIGNKISNNVETSEKSIICFVEKKKKLKNLKVSELIPSMIGGVKTDVIETGKFYAQSIYPTIDLQRPVDGGICIGHLAASGTLGMWVKKDKKYHIISNNHVLASINLARIGDPIHQPWYSYHLYIEATLREIVTNPIAKLTNYIPLKRYEWNLVDVALAKARKNSYVKDSIKYIGKPTKIIEPQIDMEVKKSGFKTYLTHGRVMYTNVSIGVSYMYGSMKLYFYDQIMTNKMSLGGDSGSILVTSNGQNVVGLLFAGSRTFTLYNRFSNILEYYDITL